MEFQQEPPLENIQVPSLEDLLYLDAETARRQYAARKAANNAQTTTYASTEAINPEPTPKTISEPEKIQQTSAQAAAINFKENLKRFGLQGIEQHLTSLTLNTQTEIEKALNVFGFSNRLIVTKSLLKQHYREIIKLVHPDQYSHEPKLFISFNNILRELNRIYAQLSTQINN